MELLSAGSAASSGVADPGRKTFRHNPVGDLVIALLFGLCLIGWIYGLVQLAGSSHPLMWVVVGPIAVVSVPLLFVVSSTSLQSFRSGFRSTNWLAHVGLHGVHLNLRSYRNSYSERVDPTVVFLAFSEIDQAAQVVEHYVEKRADGDVQERVRYLELTLAGVDTAPLTRAVRSEQQRDAPLEQGWIGRSSTKHHHVPVFCPAPGVVRVEWNRRLFRALSKRVATGPRRDVDLNKEFSRQGLEGRVRALVQRGNRLAAMRLLQTEKRLDARSAKAWLADHS